VRRSRHRASAAHPALGNSVEHAAVFVHSTLQLEGRTSIVEWEDRSIGRTGCASPLGLDICYVLLVLLKLMPWLLVVLTLPASLVGSELCFQRTGHDPAPPGADPHEGGDEMPNFWPHVATLGVTAQQRRQSIEAEIQRQLEAGEIDQKDVNAALERLFRQAQLGPRSISAADPLMRSKLHSWDR
jgi:hypothetical protein